MIKALLSSLSQKGFFALRPLHSGPRPDGRDPRAGQAYTEYLVILGFGVLLAFGMALSGANEGSILNRLYGYIFDYHASLANFLNLPFF